MMSEDKEPDWLAELAKGGEALRRQMAPLVEAAERLAGASRWPVPPIPQRIVRAVDAAMRELLPPPQPPDVRYSSFRGYISFTGTMAGTANLTGVGTITASGSVALPPLRASGQLTIENPPSGPAERSIGQILALVLVAIVTSGLLGVQGPDRATVDHYLTVLSFALPIAVLIWSKQK